MAPAWGHRVALFIRSIQDFIEVLNAWDNAQTTFRSEKLQIAYLKAEIDTGKYVFFVSFEDHCMFMYASGCTFNVVI